ncbi:MAG TPA: 1-acyl-sn-glycerol-3-phosphate acyltransferase [Flavisolibacter sp.]
MLYSLLKSYARLAIRIYCARIRINRPEVLSSGGPLLIAANHPNSFLDGIILTTLFDNQVYSLARGDAFQHPVINRLLRRLRLLPVYRTSEGVHNLGHNYTTFDACHRTFRNNGIVLIFSEGRCENEWHLRPLKKGTARLATTAWQNSIPLRVLPLGINYSSFKKFGKEVHLNFGTAITSSALDPEATDGRQLVHFNEMLQQQLQDLVYEIEDGDRQSRAKRFNLAKDTLFYMMLIPAVAGIVLHLPFFLICKVFTELNFKRSGHYDSVQTSLLMVFYPVYWILVTVLFGIWSWVAGIAAFLLLPLLARAAVVVKVKAGL